MKMIINLTCWKEVCRTVIVMSKYPDGNPILSWA